MFSLHKALPNFFFTHHCKTFDWIAILFIGIENLASWLVKVRNDNINDNISICYIIKLIMQPMNTLK